MVGPALGAAITYGIVDGEGDLLAARRPISEGINTVSREVEGQIRWDYNLAITRVLPACHDAPVPGGCLVEAAGEHSSQASLL